MKYCSSCQASYPLDYTACPKDQTPLQMITDLVSGLVLRGKYEILEKLGAGGMGAVYKARHLAFGELRAIKFVGSHLLSDERILARFRAEAVVARRLQHPNAVKVEDLDATDDGRPFIVMEYVKGRSLRDLFCEENEVSTKRILALARQACAALAAAHALGIVHRDIKPDNLMIVVGPDGREILKVADFGLAKVREGFDPTPGSALTQTGFIVGTPPYMSPEQASGLEVDGRSDLYSLGVVLYELFTGRLPFQSDSPLGMLIHHRETPPQPPGGLGVPQVLAEFLLKALAKGREDRFQTAEQMDESLRLLAEMPLPEFVGQGIRAGFDPRWAGSRHASRMTTTQAPVPPRAGGASRPGALSAARTTTRVSPPPTQRNRPPSRAVKEEPAEPSSMGFWLKLGVVAVLGGWLVTNRVARAPAPAPPPAPRPSPSVGAEVPAPSSTPDQAAPERSDIAIRFDIDRLLGGSTGLADARIRVEVVNGVATLVGDAPNATAAQLAQSLTSTVAGVRQVFNMIRVAAETGDRNPTRPLTGATATPMTAQAELPRSTAPGAEAALHEQVRTLLDRAREKLEARNPEAAEADFRTVLSLEPNNPVAKDALERLKNRLPPPQGPPPGPRPTP